MAVGGLKKLFSLRLIEDAEDEVESAVSERERDGTVGSVWRDSGAKSWLPDASENLRGEPGAAPFKEAIALESAGVNTRNTLV